MQTNLSSQRDHTSEDYNTVIVGVDGSKRNQAAVAWARQEALETKSKLGLVAAIMNDGTMPMPRFSADYTVDYAENQTRDMLAAIRSQLPASTAAQDVTTQVSNGKPAHIILLASQTADLVVVGKRGKGAVRRFIVGSTSIAVAGRARVPVVVVPDEWVQTVHASDPIIVGVDGTTRDEAVLEFAFQRARDLAVPLIAVYAWQLPDVYTWSPGDIEGWSEEASSELDARIRPMADRYTEVELVRLPQMGQAAMTLLDAGNVAQLIVLGRHTSPEHRGGFAFGSTTRGVLHYSTCPVVVIPEQVDAESKAL